MEMKNKTKVIGTRVTMHLAKLIEEYCHRDCHVNPADFIRDAIREKIQWEAPELYAKLFKETKDEQPTN